MYPFYLGYQLYWRKLKIFPNYSFILLISAASIVMSHLCFVLFFFIEDHGPVQPVVQIGK